MNATVSKPAVKTAPARRMNTAAVKKASAKTAPVQAKAPAAADEGPSAETLAKAANMFAGLAKKNADAKAAKAGGKTTATPKVKAAPAEPKVKKVAVTFVPRTFGKGKVAHCIAEHHRPTSGSRLFAHTQAALTALGMFAPERPAVPEKALLTIMGQRAVTYHTKQMNFERVKDHGIRLTAQGYNAFRERAVSGKVDGGLANDFLAILIDGKAAPSTQVQQDAVYQVALS